MAITYVFAGMPTANYAAALPWFERLFGRPPDLLPQDEEAAWELTGTLEFCPTTNGTQARWRWNVTPRGALKLLTPLISRGGQRTEERVWTGLKAYLEAPYDQRS
ncbi:MAG: hypothetical protein WEC79_01430 [Thermomicrobiales bacterium]